MKVKILGPEGELLRTGNCGLKNKAQWFIRKNMGDVIKDDDTDYIIKLHIGRFQFFGPWVFSTSFFICSDKTCSGQSLKIRENLK